MGAKEAAKFDHELEKQVCDWVEAVTGMQKGGATMGEWLHDGQVLCALANAIKPGAVKKPNTSSLAFKQMENIKFFTDAAREMGVPESSMFGTPDLYEEKHMGVVVTALSMFAGIIQVSCPDFKGPHLGVAVNTTVDDKSRGLGLVTDQTEAMNRTMEVERPRQEMKR